MRIEQRLQVNFLSLRENLLMSEAQEGQLSRCRMQGRKSTLRSKVHGAARLLSAAEDVRAVQLRQLRVAPGLALGVVALIL